MRLAIICLLSCGMLFAQSVDTSKHLLSTTAEALTVKANRIPHGELATTRLSQMDIYLNATAKADPLLAVNTLPAATNPDETANVSLRGSPSEATGIYLNGVPLHSAVRIDQSNGVGQFSIFGQLPLRELRVYPSSPPLNFSQASAGAVAIETAHERPAQAMHGLSLNLVGIGYNHVQPVGEAGVLRGYVNANDLTAFRALNGRKLEDLRESRSVDGMLSYASEGRQGGSLQLFYLGFAESYRYDFRDLDAAGQFQQRKPRHLGVANFAWQSGEWAWKANQLLDWEKPTFEFGAETLTVERFTTHTAIHAERRWPGLTVQTGSAINNYWAPGGHRYVGEIYGHLQYRKGPLLFSGGLKPVYDGAATVNLQTAGRLELGRGSLHLTAGRHTQLLSPGRFLNAWQRLRLRQLALEYRYRHGYWEIEAAFYGKRELYGTAGAIKVVGAESQLTYRSGNYLFGLGLVAVRSRAERPTVRDIPLSLRGRLQWNAGGWSAGVQYRDRSGKPTGEFAMDDWPRYGSYQRLDASLTKTLITKIGALILYLNVNNLFDTKNVSAYSFRGEEYYSRRTVFFGSVLNW